jgi:N-methylhydantoinase B
LPQDGQRLPAAVEGGLPLYPGVVQKAGIAFALASGAALARAPAHWTDGCPTLDELRGDRLSVRSFLDPLTGRILLVDTLPRGEQRTIATLPTRWTTAGGNRETNRRL